MVHPAVPTPPNDGASLTGPGGTPQHTCLSWHTPPSSSRPTHTRVPNPGAPDRPLSRPALRSARPDCTRASFRCAIALKRHGGDHEEAATGRPARYSSAKVMKPEINAAEEKSKTYRCIFWSSTPTSASATVEVAAFQLWGHRCEDQSVFSKIIKKKQKTKHTFRVHHTNLTAELLYSRGP